MSASVKLPNIKVINVKIHLSDKFTTAVKRQMIQSKVSSFIFSTNIAMLEIDFNDIFIQEINILMEFSFILQREQYYLPFHGSVKF